MDMVAVFHTFNSVEAQVVRGRLEAAGLFASIRNELSALASGAGIASVTYLVDVPAADAAAARALIELSESTGPAAA